jgi:RNA polymerase sigma factor (sigma-70 family)
MTDDAALLKRYSVEGSEEAFRQLVERHLPMVYAAAERQLGGDRPLAEDVAQQVFCELARLAASLAREEVVVAGWLYRATRFTAAKVARTEHRRKRRESASAAEQEIEPMNATHDSARPDWHEVCAHLDDAMHELEDGERNAILLRFFQRLDFRSVGAALKTSDDTAQKRVSRALDRLRLLLAQRGVTLSTLALGALLTSHATAALPPELVADVVARSLAAAGAASISAGGAVAVESATRFFNLKAAVGIGVLLAAAAWTWLSAGKGTPPTGAIPPGIVSWWSGEGTAVDRQGMNHGLLQGRVEFVAGMVGQAFRFDGREGTRLVVPHSPSLSLTNELTVEFWFRPDEDSNMGSLFAKRTEDSDATLTGNVVNSGFSMGRIHADHQYGICQYFNDPEQRGGHHARRGAVSLIEQLLPNVRLPGGESRFESKKSLFEQAAFFPTAGRDLSVLRGRWHHLAGTFQQLDGGRVRMISYFDGERRNQIVLQGSLSNATNAAPISIGGFPTAPFKGCVDELRIYSRALKAAEVKSVFQLAAGKSGKPERDARE